MRKMIMVAIVGIAFILMGFSSRLPAPVEDVYFCKLKTLTLFDLMDPKELPLYYNFAELTDSKPENIVVEDIDEQQFSDLRYGSFRIGNSERKVWFLMGKNSTDYWDEFYIDQNMDDKITKKEKVKSFQTGHWKEHGANALEALSYIPVPIKVSYKGITKEYEQTLYFFISTVTYSKKTGTDIVARCLNASFLEGDLKIDTGKERKLVKFRIIDANSNGCYNDFGKDLLYMDLNRDGYFRKVESQSLSEFFDSTGNEKEKKQLRLNMLPFALKFGITEVTAEFDLSQLEPVQSSETEVKPAPEKTLPKSGGGANSDIPSTI